MSRRKTSKRAATVYQAPVAGPESPVIVIARSPKGAATIVRAAGYRLQGARTDQAVTEAPAEAATRAINWRD